MKLSLWADVGVGPGGAGVAGEGLGSGMRGGLSPDPTRASIPKVTRGSFSSAGR